MAELPLVYEEFSSLLNNDSSYYSTGSIMIKAQKLISSVTAICHADYNNQSTNISISNNNEKEEVNLTSIIDTTSDNLKLYHNNHGFYCSICGKYIEGNKPNFGVCSLECFEKLVLNYINDNYNSEYLDNKDKINSISNIMDFINMLSNLSLEFTSVIREIEYLPEIYKNYFTINVNLSFIELRKNINYLLIKKNKYLIKLLNKTDIGFIDNIINSIIPSFNLIFNKIEQIRDIFNSSFDSMQKTLSNSKLKLEPESMGFLQTSRSSIKTHKGELIIKMQPTDNFYQYSSLNIIEDSIKNKRSMINNIDYNSINNKILELLPPISEAEYFLDPKVFKQRLILSNQNQKLVSKVYNQLSKLMIYNADYLPKYSDMKLTNPSFLSALILPSNKNNWGHISKDIFGLPR